MLTGDFYLVTIFIIDEVHGYVHQGAPAETASNCCSHAPVPTALWYHSGAFDHLVYGFWLHSWHNCDSSLLYYSLQVLNYSTAIFIEVGLTDSSAQYATLGTSGVIVFMTLCSVLFVDKVGRRPLHLLGLTGCLISMIVITIALFVQVCSWTADSYSEDLFLIEILLFCSQVYAEWTKYLSVVSLIFFIMSFAIGPGSIPWFITAELFDQTARPYAISIATLVNWTANFLSGLLFPIMKVRSMTPSKVKVIVLCVWIPESMDDKFTSSQSTFYNFVNPVVPTM